MKNILIKYKFFIIVGLLFVVLTTYYSYIVVKSVSKYNGYTIVIDAGHGGRDGGSVGYNGTIEKEINLKYAMCLKEKLVSNGFRVVLTRKNDDGLYSALDKNKKQSDMLERFKIIKKTNPSLVVSLHMNSFKDSSVRGATTYYRLGDDSGQLCADYIQKSLNSYCDAKSTKANVGDYYILNCNYYSAVLIECGFISNPQEEQMLNSNEYMKKIIQAIYNGIYLYFGNNNI